MRLRPRLQKVLSDLAGNRQRSLLVLASIAVGLFAIGVITTIYVVGPDDMRSGYAATNPPNIAVQALLFDRCAPEHIAQTPGVRQVEAVRYASTRLQTGPNDWAAIDLRTAKDLANLQIGTVTVVNGKWPPGEREIVIDQYKLPDTNAEVGDMIELETPSGKTKAVRLVGVIQDLGIGAFRGAGGFFNAPIQGFVTQETLEWLEQPQPKRYNTLLLTVQGDDQDEVYLESVAQQVREELERCNVQVISVATRSSTEHPNLFLSQAILAVLLVIGLLVAFLSGFLITNTLQAIMNQQVQQIGILKTVGARRYQVMGIYLLLSLLFGALAFVIAAPLAPQVAFPVIDFLTVQMNYIFYGPRLVPEAVIAQAVLAVLLPVSAALLPVWQGANISVQEALSGLSQRNPPNQGWLDRKLSGLRRRSLLLVVSLRNTFRRKGRLLLTLVTLTLGGAVFIATFSVRVSLLDYVNQIVQYFLADVNITLDRAYRIEEIEGLIRQVPGVKQVEGWMFARTEIVLADGSVGESVSLLAPPAASPLVKPILVAGRWLQPGDRNAIALSELFKDAFPDLEVGDTLRLRVEDKETDWVVVGFFQLAGKVSGYSAYTSYEYLSELLNQPGRAVAFRVVSQSPNLNNLEQEALGQAVEAHLSRNGIRVVDMTTGKHLLKTATDGFDVLTSFLLFLAILTALTGSIGLTGAMSLNVMERTREIGILRAIGASDKALMRIVLTEGALIGMMSWVLSSLAAFPISELMSDSISQSMFGGPANFGFSPIGYVLWLVAVSALAVVASVMPARNATRLTIREVLSYE